MSFLAKYSPVVQACVCLMLDSEQQLAWAGSVLADWADTLQDDWTLILSPKDYEDFVSFCAQGGFQARPEGEYLQ